MTNKPSSVDDMTMIELPVVKLADTELEIGKASSAPTKHYPTGAKLLVICTGLLLTNLLVALDQTVITAAVPKIANDFQRLNDVGWYASAYYLTAAATQPIWGRGFSYFSQKWLFFSSVFVFMIGSLICAVAKDSTTFIVGRAVAGVGFGGIYIGVFAVTASILPLEKQALFQSLIGASYGLGATTGPIIGGALTSRVTWRWCFYLNLPVAGVTLPLIALFLNLDPIPQTKSVSARLKSMDWIGTVVLIGAFTCILLALQDGGVKSPWSSGRSIGLIVGFGILFIIFFGIQIYEKEDASINIRLFRKRNILAIALTNVSMGGSYFGMLYELPVYFQAVRGSTPIHSGVQVLPFIIVVIATLIVTGGIVNKTGNFNINLLVGLAISAVGNGCCSFLGVDTGTGTWVGLQIVAAFVGMTVMMPLIACQALVDADDRNASTTIAIFFQTLGATVLVSVYQSVYQNKLLEGIKLIPGLDVEEVIGSGLSTFRQTVPTNLLPMVVKVAAHSLHDAFIGYGV